MSGSSVAAGCHDETVEIRRAQRGDAAGIAVVHVESWRTGYRGLIPQEHLDGLDPEQRRGRWEEMLDAPPVQGSGIVVALEDGHIIGFAQVCPARDDDADSAAIAELTAVYVRPDCWGKGAGRALLVAVPEHLPANFSEVTLWVLAANSRARRFYEAGGWQADGSAKLYETGGVSLAAIRYRRPLSDPLS